MEPGKSGLQERGEGETENPDSVSLSNPLALPRLRHGTSDSKSSGGFAFPVVFSR